MPTIPSFKEFEPFIKEREGMLYVEWKKAYEILEKYDLVKDFDIFLQGQTCFEDGVYACDIMNFLRKPAHRFFD